MSVIHVLSIGNSFSQDAQRYLHDLAKTEGIHIETVNLYISGCPLERHFRNMHSERKEYALEINGHVGTGFMVSLKEALTARNWDFVTLQQASGFSYKEESYQPYLNELAAYVRKLCPKAKLMLHQTWGYESGSDRILAQGYEVYEDMFADIKRGYEKAASDIEADGMIPSGEAFLNALRYVEKIHRDGFHASLGLGRFILALVWYKAITGKDIRGVSFKNFDLEVSEQEYQVAIDAVEKIAFMESGLT